MPESRRGVMLGFAAYGLWGVFPLYWPLLEPAGAGEILAHRIVWSALVMAALVLALGRADALRALLRNRRARTLLAVGALLVSINWLTYIWAVNNERVVESSLGYFINPLVNVFLGVAVLGERLRVVQSAALALATVAVVVLTVEYGRLPWVALVLALTFGTYGLVKKLAGVGAVESLAFETALAAPVAGGYLIWLATTGAATFAAQGTGHALLLASTGVVTAVPLLCFGGAANRVTLVTLGLLQYVAPTLQFLIGVWWYHEAMSPGRWVGFVLVWAALAVVTVDAVRHHRRETATVAAGAAGVPG